MSRAVSEVLPQDALELEEQVEVFETIDLQTPAGRRHAAEAPSKQTPAAPIHHRRRFGFRCALSWIGCCLPLFLGGWLVVGTFFMTLPWLEPLSWSMGDLVVAGIILIVGPLSIAILVAVVIGTARTWQRCVLQKPTTAPVVPTAIEESVESASIEGTADAPAGGARRKLAMRCCAGCTRVCCRCSAIMFWGAIWIVFLVRMGRKHGSQHLDDIHPSL